MYNHVLDNYKRFLVFGLFKMCYDIRCCFGRIIALKSGTVLDRILRISCLMFNWFYDFILIPDNEENLYTLRHEVATDIENIIAPGYSLRMNVCQYTPKFD